MSPTLTTSGETVLMPSSVLRLAESGRISNSDEIERLERLTAVSWNNSPTLKNSITPTASGSWWMAIAPRVAIVIRKFSSNTCPLRILRPALVKTPQPLNK